MQVQEKIRALRERRTVTLEADGIEFIVKIPTIQEMTDHGIDPTVADITSETVEGEKKTLTDQMAAFRPIAMKTLALCMEEPKFHHGDGECPEDAVTEEDLGNYTLGIARAIFTIMNEQIGGVGKATATFRLDTNGEDGDQGGADVGDEPA